MVDNKPDHARWSQLCDQDSNVVVDPSLVEIGGKEDDDDRKNGASTSKKVSGFNQSKEVNACDETLKNKRLKSP